MATGYNTEWLQQIDSSGADYMTSIDYDTSYNYIYACGYSDATSNIVTISGINYPKPFGLTQAAYIVRYDICGGGRLLQFIDGSGTSGGETSVALRLDSSGNVYHSGNSISNSITISGIQYNRPGLNGVNKEYTYLVKLRQDYSVQWVQFFDCSGTPAAVTSCTSSNIRIDANGSIYHIAQTTGTTDVFISGVVYPRVAGSGINTGSYIIKYNTNGAMLWFQAIDGPQTENINGITTDSSRNVYVCGTSNSTAISISGINIPRVYNDYASYVVKYNENGTMQWYRFIYNTTIGSLSKSVTVDSSNNIYVLGSIFSSAPSITISGNNLGVIQTYNIPITTAPNAYIVKFSPDGAVLSVKFINNANAPYTIYIKNQRLFAALRSVDNQNISISGISYPTYRQIGGHTYLIQFDLNLAVVSDNFTDVSSSAVDMNSIVSDGTNIYSATSVQLGIGSNFYLDYSTYTKPYGNTNSSYINKYRIANIPPTPTNLTGTGGILNSSLFWDSQYDANIYKVYYGVSGVITLSGLYYNSNPTIITGLSAGTYYNFYVTSLNAVGQSSPSSTIYTLTAPLTPSGLTSFRQIQSIRLTWNSATTATSYKIYYGLSGTLDLSASFTGLSGTISGLTSDVWYNFTVVAINATGESAQSTAIYNYSLFPSPTGLIAVPDLNSIDLSWSPVSGATIYKVYYGLSGYYSYTKNSALTYTSISGVPNQWYIIAVIATGNIPGSESSYSTPVYSMAYSDAPNAVSASNSVESSVVTWQSLYNINTYKVYYGLSGTFDLSASFTFPIFP